jgi:PKD repeat protein
MIGKAFGQIQAVANTSMQLPITNGLNFTSFGNQPSQDAAHPGTVSFTASGNSQSSTGTNPPGSVNAILIYSGATHQIVSPPIAESDNISIFKTFYPRHSFRNGVIAFQATNNTAQGFGGIWRNDQNANTGNVALYNNTQVITNISGSVDTKSTAGLSPTIDVNGDIYWIYEYTNSTVPELTNQPNVQTWAIEKTINGGTPSLVYQFTTGSQTFAIHSNAGNISIGSPVGVWFNGHIYTVASTQTPDPSVPPTPGKSTFTSFYDNSYYVTPAFEGNLMAFKGKNSFYNQSGIYARDFRTTGLPIVPTTTPMIVADLNNVIPDGANNKFTMFDDQICIDNSQIVFVGGRPNPTGSTKPYQQKGIYVAAYSAGSVGTVTTVVDLNTPLDFGAPVGMQKPIDIEIGPEGLAGGRVVFWAQYDGTHSGIFIATVPGSTIVAPVAQFTTQPQPPQGPAPLTIGFTDTSTGNITSQVWNFGDSQSSTMPNPTHTYGSSGTYTVTLTVTGANGVTSSATATVTVTAASPPNEFEWMLLGNSAISPANNFLGTTDSNPLIVKTKNTERMRIDPLGKIGIGTTSPSVDFDLEKINSGDYGPVLGIVNRGSGKGTTAAMRFGVDPSDITGGLPGGGSDFPNGEIKAVNMNSTGQNDTDIILSSWTGKSLNEALHVQGATGYLGIGTASPTSPVDIESTGVPFFGQLKLESTDPKGLAGLLLQATNQTQYWTIGVNGISSSYRPSSLVFAGPGPGIMEFSKTGDLKINGSLNQGSDRNSKENFVAVDTGKLLEKVDSLQLSEWNYKADSNTRHLGPMAQDFYSAFQLGQDDKHIATIDAEGVTLGAIQELNKVQKEKDAKIVSLEERIAILEKTVAELQKRSSPAK